MDIQKILFCLTARIFSSRYHQFEKIKFVSPSSHATFFHYMDIGETFKSKTPQFCIYFKSTVNSVHLNSKLCNDKVVCFF